MGPSHERHPLGIAAAIAAAGLWGMGGTVASGLFSAGVQPLELVAVRTLLTLVGLALLDALRWRPTRTSRAATPRRQDQPRLNWALVVAFGLAVALASGFLFLAIDQLPVAVAMVLQSLAPAFVVGWLIVLGRRSADYRTGLGLLAILAGVALVVNLPVTGLGGINVLGVAFGLATAAAVAVFSVLGGRAASEYGALRANTYAFAVSSLAWLMFLLPWGAPQILSLSHGHQIVGIVAVGLLGTLAPFLLYTWGTARIGPKAGAVNISLEPIFSALLAWAWLGQRLDRWQIIGGAVLIAAVISLQRQPASPVHRSDVTENPIPAADRPTNAVAIDPISTGIKG